MTTNDPFGPAQQREPDEERYTPPPATEAPAQWPTQWAPPVQYYPGTAAYPPGTYGQSYQHDEPYGSAQDYPQSYGRTESYGQFGPGYGYGYGYGYPAYGAQYAGGTQGLSPVRKRNARLLAGLAAAVVAAALVLFGVGFATGSSSSSTSGSGSALQELPQLQVPSDTPGGGSSGSGNGGALPNGGSSAGGSNPVATATQQIGIVTIVSTLRYQNAESAGTGMILSSDGEVLTNNHVVNGATAITVTVESTGKSYRADVVGTAPTKDVAVLKLRNASGLQTAELASTSQDIKVGDAVVGVGNAGGTGTLTAASGKVTGLDKSITATDESGADAERLTELIEVDAPIISGDSGGPLYDADGEIIGIDTAASTHQQSGTANTAYAIRIENALGVVRQIESGVQTTTIHIGLPAFVGFSLQDQNGTVIVPEPSLGGGQTIVPDSPADQVGIEPGSTVTALGGTKVTSAAQIKRILAAKNPGDQISINWTDAGGDPHSATLTLTTGPAD
ncbi:trypsin-like peptidase domain-containing protein [uncultured Jatrophihabitans sp.]|uniref:trypsin-like peptidase domain-containing protein n=1 Tax=uncultured Jatrophihabitans sp. TaxID=1610747 RepID=UPI0035CC7484